MKQSVYVLSTLRKLILDGELSPTEKLAEIPLAERLGVSRTPVRLALRTLEQEGLVQKRAKRGYLVREFSETDVQCALEVRGVLEGLAARRLCEKGLTKEVEATLHECISAGEKVLSKGYLTESDADDWSDLNGKFHHTIITASHSGPIEDAIARNNHLAFASVDSLIIDTQQLDKEYSKLSIAHFQHKLVVDALVRGEGSRAEMLMREHAYVGMRYSGLLDK
jgi:GntR family transcriptional regulator of vanillate catabolism